MSDHAPPAAQLPPRPVSLLTENAECLQRPRPGSSPHASSRPSHAGPRMGPPHGGTLLPQGLCTCCSPCPDPLPSVALRLTLRLLLGLCLDVPGPWALLTLPYETTSWAVASRLSLTRPWYESTLRFRAPVSPLGHRLPVLSAALALTCGAPGTNQMPTDICRVWEPEGCYVPADEGLDSRPPPA